MSGKSEGTNNNLKSKMAKGRNKQLKIFGPTCEAQRGQPEANQSKSL